MAVDDLFTKAEVHELDEWRTARRAAEVHDDDEGEEPRL